MPINSDSYTDLRRSAAQELEGIVHHDGMATRSVEIALHTHLKSGTVSSLTVQCLAEEARQIVREWA